MKYHKKYKPYARRANGSERSESMRIAFRLALYQASGKPFYVLVQRGFPNLAIEVGMSKRDVMSLPCPVAFGRSTFRAWASRIQKHARG